MRGMGGKGDPMYLPTHGWARATWVPCHNYLLPVTVAEAVPDSTVPGDWRQGLCSVAVLRLHI